MTSLRNLLFAAAFVSLASTSTLAAISGAESKVHADLARQAKISLEAARKIALAKVPGGVVKSEELEREKGRLIYSFDIAVAGRPGVEEINVSAVSGKILAQNHESAKDEKKEEAPSPPSKPHA